jgi:hypothetical protein
MNLTIEEERIIFNHIRQLVNEWLNNPYIGFGVEYMQGVINEYIKSLPYPDKVKSWQDKKFVHVKFIQDDTGAHGCTIALTNCSECHQGTKGDVTYYYSPGHLGITELG